MIRRVASMAVLLWLSGCDAVEAVGKDVPTTVVESSQEFVRRITADGYLEAVEATPISTPPEAQGAMKIRWIADDGTTVKPGDVVVRFDSSALERKLADGNDDIESAKRQIQKEKLAGRTARQKRVRTSDVARTEASVAREFDVKDSNIMSRSEMADAAIDLEMAEARARHSDRVQKIERSVSSDKVDVLKITRDQAARELTRTGDALGKLVVEAPHDGILVLEMGWRGNTVGVGDTVWPGQKLAEIPLVTKMQAEVFVLEASAGDLAKGLAAEVTLDAHAGVTYQAKVERVDTLAKPRHPEVPVQYFGVTLALDKTDVATMKVGQRVRATIIVRNEDVVVAPRQALFEVGGKTVVYRATGDGFEPVEVTLGPASPGRVVLETGIDAGDRIALRDPTQTSDDETGKSGGAADAPGGRGSP